MKNEKIAVQKTALFLSARLWASVVTAKKTQSYLVATDVYEVDIIYIDTKSQGRHLPVAQRPE
jgi:hypothetical protein